MAVILKAYINAISIKYLNIDIDYVLIKLFLVEKCSVETHYKVFCPAQQGDNIIYNIT